MSKDLSHYRDKYLKGELIENNLPNNPLDLFSKWFSELENNGNEREPNAMSLSTVDKEGFPTTRIVLLKEFSDSGFIFFTNYNSRKGNHIKLNPQTCLSFYWPSLERQVIIHGTANKISEIKSDKYFNSRPESSRIGAIVSDQSEVIPSRDFIDNKLKNFNVGVNSLKRPKHWGGYNVIPKSIEFWQGRESRLHDRIFYFKNNEQWEKNRLSP
jgi:pyridoxamine 5'-phosphate oxidase